MDTTTPQYPKISASDRLTFTVFLALVLHLVIILGVAIEFPDAEPAPTSLEVILTQYSSEEAPDEADFIAQANQVGSGSAEEKVAPTTNRIAMFEHDKIQDTQPVPQQASQKPTHPNDTIAVSTQGNSTQQTVVTPTSHPNQKVKVSKEEMLENINRQIELASYEAALEEQKRAYAKRPRKRILTSASTKASHDAEYLNKWRLTVESIGNLNYPNEAKTRNIYGSLRLLVSINADGSLRDMKLLKSSGHRLLDQAAMQIVNLAAPFQPFPPEIRSNTDILEIIRTWRFEKGSLSSY